MIRFINITLLLIALVGGLQLYMIRTKSVSLHDRFAVLEEKLGVLSITDPNQYYVRSIETDDPEIFAWRIHVPDSSMSFIESRTPDSSSFFSLPSTSGLLGTSDRSMETIIAFRYKMAEGAVGPYLASTGGLCASTSPNKDQSQFLKQHWRELEFNIPMGDSIVTSPAENPIELIEISVPKILWSEFEIAFGNSARRVKARDGSFIRILCGDQTALAAQREIERRVEKASLEQLAEKRLESDNSNEASQ